LQPSSGQILWRLVRRSILELSKKFPCGNWRQINLSSLGHIGRGANAAVGDAGTPVPLSASATLEMVLSAARRRRRRCGWCKKAGSGPPARAAPIFQGHRLHVVCISLRIDLPDASTACQTTNGYVEHYSYWARTLMKDAGLEILIHSSGLNDFPGDLQRFVHTVKPLLHQ
jgi:hypothetical protein